jgi:hypothetical protein
MKGHKAPPAARNIPDTRNGAASYKKYEKDEKNPLTRER